MKKITWKQRERDVRRTILSRRGQIGPHGTRSERRLKAEQECKRWFDARIAEGLQADVSRNGRVTIMLPAMMDFADHYELTCLHLDAIRKLCTRHSRYPKIYKLASVSFTELRTISTPAALVLTAEISKWEDSIRKRLRPDVHRWDEKIFKQFFELGYFDLFQKTPEVEKRYPSKIDSPVAFVKYIKGRCGDKGKTKALKDSLRAVVSDEIDKWTFLHSGLSEAITNVSHHAYPEKRGYLPEEKYWYLTGSYNRSECLLKIVFYDQGITIPATLPSSELWERVLDYLTKFGVLESKRDETLLKAAVELDRTRTGESDRGKGLQDMLEFIKQRKNGNLSIISRRGLYRYLMDSGKEQVRSEGFRNTVNGTLIIWSAELKV